MPKLRRSFIFRIQFISAFFIFQLCCPQTSSAQAELRELEDWADLAYDSFYQSGEFDITELDSVLFLFPADSMTVGKEKLYRILASYYHNSGKAHIAFPYLIEIEKSLRNRGDSSRLPLVISGIAESYRAFGKLDFALDYGLEGIAIAERIGTEIDKGYAHGRLGAIYFARNNKDSARALPEFRKALYFYTKLDNKSEIASFLTDISTTLFASGKRAEAIAGLRKAELILDNSLLLPHIYNSLANIYLKTGPLDSVFHYAQISYDISKSENNRVFMFQASSMLQQAYDSIQNIEEAYKWSLVNNKILNFYYEDTKGTDLRIVQLEAERDKQKLANQFLEEQRSQELELNRLWKFASFILALFLGLLLVVYLMLRSERKKLVKTQKLIQQQKIEIEEQNQELTKFVSVRDKLISIVSHDFRAPLTTLKLLLDLYQSDGLNEAELKKFMLQTNIQLEKSLSMADNLLQWVKSQLSGIEAKKQQFDLVELTQELISLFSPILISNNQSIELSGTAQCQFNADLEMIKFVIRNLIQNATKYSPDNSVIKIEIEEYQDRIIWVISDSGRGMNAQELNSLFEMKADVDINDPKQGAGIGLFLAKSFVKLNGGEIEVDSAQNIGTSLKLVFSKNFKL